MKETITVNKAIDIGVRYINFPVIVIFIIGILLPLFLMIKDIIPPWSVFLGFVIGFSSCLLYWSITVTKWRIWAFENVRNVHELKRRAIQEKIIREDNSFYEKLEIRSFKEKEKWEILKNKFHIEDVFQDDITIASETRIYFSKEKNYLELFLYSLCLFVPIVIISSNEFIYGIIWLIIIIYLMYISIKNITDNSPQIIINNKGIKADSSNFHEWEEIVDDQVMKIGKYSYLVYSHKNGSVAIQIEDLNINERRLDRLLIFYRGRNKKTTTASSR